MSNPKISVIIPVYNAESTLRRCVDSVLAQTFTDFECLLINDGSKDKSGEICEEYAARDSRIRAFHKENGGVSSARNLGLDNAAGEWIAFVDSDDWVGEKYLESFSDHLDADLIIGGFLRFKNDKIVANCEAEHIKEGFYVNFRQIVESNLNRAAFCAPWAKLFKSSTAKQLRFDLKIRIGEDSIYMLDYLSNVASIRVLCSLNNQQTSYFWVQPAAEFFQKYQILVAEAIYNTKRADRAYRALGIKSEQYESFFVQCSYGVALQDMKKNGRLWYLDKDIRRISLRASKNLGCLSYLKTWIIFTFLWPVKILYLRMNSNFAQ